MSHYFKKSILNRGLDSFLADKIAWDQDNVSPYLDALLKKLDCSLEEVTLCYIDYILVNRIKVIYPWLLIAKQELEPNIRNETIIVKKKVL